PRIMTGNWTSLRPIRLSTFSMSPGSLLRVREGGRLRAWPGAQFVSRRSAGASLLLHADIEEGQAGGRNRGEVFELVGIPGGRQLAMQQRIERDFLGEEVHGLIPLFLLLVARETLG